VEFAQNVFGDRSGDEGMSDSVKEQLSACLDGELADQEMDLLLKRVSRDAELRQSLGRYAVIGEALRGQVRTPTKDFSDRLMASIESEPAIEPVRERRSAVSRNKFVRPLSGIAIAASVAIAVLSIQRIAQPPAAESVAPAAAMVAATPSSPEPSYVVPVTTQDVSFVPATRLTNYVVAHSEYTSPLSRRTLLSGVLSEDDEAASDQSSNIQVKVTSEHSEPSSAKDSKSPPARNR
jgi:sigma-E factor negative regulatory protein RseA